MNHDYRGFQPRVGFAYSPTKRTVIRSGYGIFDDPYNMTFFFVTYPQREVVIPNAPQPWVRKANETATWVQLRRSWASVPWPERIRPYHRELRAHIKHSGANPVVRRSHTGEGRPESQFQYRGAENVFVTNSGGGIDRNMRYAYSEQACLQIDQEVGKGLVVSAGYLFLRAHKQIRPKNLNVCPPGGLQNSATFCPPASVIPGPPITPFGPFPNNKLADGRDGFSGVLYTNAGLMYFLDGTGNAEYDGATLSVNDRLGQYFRFNANYTWSHTRDDGTFTTFVSTPEDLYNRALERADSVQDVRHRFVANFTADTPKKGMPLIRNLEFSSIVNLQSPRPFTIFVGNDINGDSNPVTDRVGWLPRNSYRGDRAFHFTERTKFDLAFDAFNVFNRQNVNEVTSVYGGGTVDFCGATPQHFGDAASLAIQRGAVGCNPITNGGAPEPNPLFGTARTMFNPRQLQISAKFTF